MIEALALRGGEKVLEIGAGSGYAAAVLAEIAREVFTIERIGQLAERAAANLAEAGCDNVHVRHADGTEGWSDEAPFDAILVSAGAPDVPKSLMRQLKIGARMVVPVGSDPRSQELIRITRVDDEEYEREDIADVRFVPLIGKEGLGERRQRLANEASPCRAVTTCRQRVAAGPHRASMRKPSTSSKMPISSRSCIGSATRVSC